MKNVAQEGQSYEKDNDAGRLVSVLHCIHSTARKAALEFPHNNSLPMHLLHVTSKCCVACSLELAQVALEILSFSVTENVNLESFDAVEFHGAQ